MYFPIAIDGALDPRLGNGMRSPQIAHVVHFTSLIPTRSPSSAATSSADSRAPIPMTRPATLAPTTLPSTTTSDNTLNTGFNANLPLHTWLASNVYYGSGFTNGLADSGVGPYNGLYLPVHTTFDISGGHTFGENWSVTANLLNVTGHRVLLDNSVTIGGFHYNDPRMFSAQLRYRFHF